MKVRYLLHDLVRRNYIPYMYESREGNIYKSLNKVRSVSGAAARFFLCAMRDARAAARPAARRAGTLGCRSTLWLGWWLGFKVFPAAARRDDSAARRYTKPCT
jgi:hypothetical protein